MKLNEQKIKDILLKGSYITREDIKNGEKFAKEKKSTVISYLINEQLINNDILGQAIAEFYDVPYANLRANNPSAKQVLRIPEAAAKKFSIVLFSEDEKTAVITSDDPKQVGLAIALKPLFPKKKIIINYSPSEDIQAAFINYAKSLDVRFVQIIKGEGRVAPEILDEIVSDASAFRASDVHFEPQGEEVIIRFRIDGLLQEAGKIPKKYYENILNRVKIQAHLRIDEHFTIQDGAIRYAKGDNVIDMRVSIAPTLDGEKIVIRMLSKYIRDFTLENLGLSPANEKMLLKSAKKPFGMILITGPTGSGKTTTLYALVKVLNRVDINITTIEDPVEYKIPGVNHIQVNPRANLTFSNGLRSIVRQDPDIILVGEIRDLETAEISVNAALTGHLLFSTFHANDAATAMPRLLDMGVEPFLMASTLELIISQRLVRRICENCRYSVSTPIKEIKKLFPEPERYFSKDATTLYKGKGCSNCGGTGYKGRIAIYEFITVDRAIKDLVLENPSSDKIWDLARKNGSASLFEDGIEKVKNGVTTIEELLRVANP